MNILLLRSSILAAPPNNSFNPTRDSMPLKILPWGECECLRAGGLIRALDSFFLSKVMILRHLFYCFLIASLIIDTGCCRIRQLDQPKLPDHVRGWTEMRSGNLIFINELILKTGESLDNGDFGLRLTDIQHPPCKSVFSMKDSDPKIKLQFYKVSNNQVICDTQIISGGLWTIDAVPTCSNRLPIDGMVIYKINSENRWIHIALFREVQEHDK